MSDTLSDRTLWMLKKKPMTVEEIRVALFVSRSTANNVLKHLRGKGLVCITRYEPTGVKPVAYYGLGKTDAPRPPPITLEEKNRRRREAKARARELPPPPPTGPRRDIAASWI
jgi:DNA-binding transcriptional ArsR family regulator